MKTFAQVCRLVSVSVLALAALPASAQVAPGGFTYGGTTVGGTSFAPDGSVTIGTTNVGGVKVGGVTYGGINVGGIKVGGMPQAAVSSGPYVAPTMPTVFVIKRKLSDLFSMSCYQVDTETKGKKYEWPVYMSNCKTMPTKFEWLRRAADLFQKTCYEVDVATNGHAYRDFALDSSCSPTALNGPANDEDRLTKSVDFSGGLSDAPASRPAGAGQTRI